MSLRLSGLNRKGVNNVKLNIIYIHGFASAGNGDKASALRDYYKGTDTNIIAPTLPVDPREAMKMLYGILLDIPGGEAVVMMGTSLGGLYALAINADCGVPALVINPLLDASSMMKFVGVNKNYATGEDFEFTKDYVDALIALEQDISDPVSKNVSVFLSRDDEKIPFEASFIRCVMTPYDVYTFAGGGHRFSIFPTILSSMMGLIIQRYVEHGIANYKLRIQETD